MAMLPIEAGTHCVGGSIDDQAAPLSRRSRAKRRIHTEQFCSRNLIVTPDVSLPPRPQPAEPQQPPVKDPQPYKDPVEPPPRDPQEDRPMRDPVEPDADRPRS